MGYKDILGKILYRPIRFNNINKIKKFYKNSKITASKLKKPNSDDRILVLAPHIDDETIGMGGYLLNYGEFIDLIYLTDSNNSNTDSEKIGEIRKKEAIKIKDITKIKNLEIFPVPNGLVKGYEEDCENRLKKIILENKYNKIFTVSPIDAHVEHRWVTERLFKVVRDFDFIDEIYLYEVSNLLPNFLINSYLPMDKNIFDKKAELYNIFQSQLKDMDFDIYNSLNRGKGIAMGEYSCEFFTKLNLNEFIEFMEKLDLDDIQKIIPYRIGNNRSFYKVINNEDKAQEEYKRLLKS